MYRPGSSLTKAKTSKAVVNTQAAAAKVQEQKLPTLEEYVKLRDWVGAISILENEKSFKDSKKETNLWLAYCYFHIGDYKYP